ncbi:MAG: tRNA pseudouridine(38-40) synthase TruA [Chloroflexi bacterium]|nr:tRNA pseudouridine(38-40) synthase TruA [Chloroflexota bacterium]
MVLEYDGTKYCGFQYQAGVATIQGELEKAIFRLTGEQRRVLGASRTDAGVHAAGQVVSFKTKSSYGADVIVNGLNYYMPEDIVVKEAHRIEDKFNVRRKAVSREYQYNIVNQRTRSPLYGAYSHLVKPSLDVEAMDAASSDLRGTHDFTSFITCPMEKSTTRTVYEASVEKRGCLVVFRIVASSFLPHQVRNTVGVLIKIGLKKLGVDHIRYLLETKRPGLACPMAPARGLVLVKVNYAEPLGVR